VDGLDAIEARWASASEPFGDAVRDYHAARGRSADSPAVVSTVKTNTELVPKRARIIIDTLAKVTGSDPRGAFPRVLEVGCGFGALAAYLAVALDARELVAVDNRADLIDVAVRSAEAAGMTETLTFVHADARALHRAGDEPFDLVVLNNAFIYLPTRADQSRALRELATVTAPGGRLVMYHANRWTPREPFTKDPIVHLLPAPVARIVGRVSGWKGNHGRVRLVSPLELRRKVRAAGFEDVHVGGVGRDGFEEGRLLRSFYALVARRAAV
jgi:ubiquinone/menaquinone biosynthesis C-methylase UbiE